jgi:protein TonB
MPLPSSQPNPARIAIAVAIVGVHVGLIATLLSQHRDPRSNMDAGPIVVRLLAQPKAQSQWQPPKVTTVLPQVALSAPDVPLIDTPVVAPPSEHAISIPGAVASVRQSSEQRGEEAKQIAAVEYLREPDPRYPSQSRKLREQGMVVLRVCIDEQGVAYDVQIETSSGHHRLDRAAREAIARAEFRPYVEDGRARRALVLIPIEFSLSRGPARIAANGA